MQAKKYYGQNFISDKNLIAKIVSCLKNDGNTLVIEIGPGMGALTNLLIKQFKKVIAIEIDKDLEPILNEKFKESNFSLIMGDILEIDINQIIINEKNNYSSIVLISNTPYYITSEILFKSFLCSDNLSQSVFMFQKEVAERVCASVGDKKYNNLSVVTRFYGAPKYEFSVKKNMFMPIPKVDSAIVSIDFLKNHKTKIENIDVFVKMVRNLFNNRRKTILNNIKNSLPNENATEILKKANIFSGLRPENLSLDDFINIYNIQNKKITD